WSWVFLNLGYVLITISLMHKRLLQGEKWRWYRDDVAVPILAAAVVGLIFRFVLPPDVGRAAVLAGIALASVAVLVTASMSAPLMRRQLAHYLPRAFARTV